MPVARRQTNEGKRRAKWTNSRSLFQFFDDAGEDQLQFMGLLTEALAFLFEIGVVTKEEQS